MVSMLVRSDKATGCCTTGSRARIWNMHDGAPAHFSRAVRDVLSNTYHGTGGPTAWSPCLSDLTKLLEAVPLAAEHECGTCMIVLRHILAALCEMFSVTPIMVQEDPLHGLHAGQI
jgi:hypothetical protein